MTQPTPRRWAKHYRSPASCRSAAAHHQWLAGLGAPVPQLRAIGGDYLEFDHVTGRHAQPRDLLQIAELLGRLHRAAYITDLHHARLDRPYTTSTGLTIPDFLSSRRPAITTLLTSGIVPAAPFTADQAVRELQTGAQGAACLYKDSNPRNFLITTRTTECVLVDFDVLTLAPAGYDLAKLVVTLTMTHGLLPTPQVRAALAAYNAALTDASLDLRPVPWAALMTWADIHHILTALIWGAAATGTPGYLRQLLRMSLASGVQVAERERLVEHGVVELVERGAGQVLTPPVGDIRLSTSDQMCLSNEVRLTPSAARRFRRTDP